MHVYIAGPLSGGNVAANIRAAAEAAARVLAIGHVPFVPHLSHFWHTLTPMDYEDWIAYDLKWLEKCDGLIRLPGESPGADREVQAARKMQLPVWNGIEEFLSCSLDSYRASLLESI